MRKVSLCNTNIYRRMSHLLGQFRGRNPVEKPSCEGISIGSKTIEKLCPKTSWIIIIENRWKHGFVHIHQGSVISSGKPCRREFLREVRFRPFPQIDFRPFFNRNLWVKSIPNLEPFLSVLKCFKKLSELTNRERYSCTIPCGGGPPQGRMSVSAHSAGPELVRGPNFFYTFLTSSFRGHEMSKNNFYGRSVFLHDGFLDLLSQSKSSDHSFSVAD